MQLEADRVLLRDFRGDDVTELQRYHADPDFLEFYAPDVATPEHAKLLVELFVRTARAQPRLDFSLAVVDRGSAQLIGCCSLRTAGQDPGKAQFGLELAPKFWGRGLAAESARELLAFGFETLQLDEIRAESVTANERVQKLVAKLGFSKIGERTGAAWMAERGWTHSVWSLTKAAFTGFRLNSTS